MKKIFIPIVILISCISVQAASESICLHYGTLGELFAEGREIMSEKDMLNTIEKKYTKDRATSKDKISIQALERTTSKQKLILNYVVTMELDAVNARKMVYLKCKAGDFD